MTFKFFIALTMLIALISQHATMGLPVSSTIVEKTCSEGLEIINGKCVPKYSTTISTEIETSETMIIHDEEPVTELNIPKKSGGCSKGMKHGICEEIQLPNTTEVNIELTTENVGGVENIKGCPKGTEPDEQGACQEIKPTNSTKTITNLKVLLNKDGSCPDNYKIIEGRCLYIKSKINSTLYPGDSTRLQTRNGVEQSSKVELVPVLPDNSCPIGTEYSEYGLCQKHAHASNLNPRLKPDGSCPNDFELINGKCTYKNSKIHVPSESTTRKIRTIKSTTPNQDTIISEEFSTSTGESKVTSTPL
jgi:hypothetical protein